MDSHLLRSVDIVRKGDAYPYMIEMERLRVENEIQKTIIDDLSKAMGQMEVDFRTEIGIKDMELASLREQCERYQCTPQVLEDNSPPRDVQQTLDPSQRTLEAEKETEKTFERINDLDSGLVEGLTECTTVSCIKEQCTENTMLEDGFKSNPINALQILCQSRDWGTPKYVFFEHAVNSFEYSAECTVMTCTVRVDGLLKKDAKRQAAIMMYEKVKNIARRSDSPTAKTPEENAPCTSTEGNCQIVTNELTRRSEAVEPERVVTVDTALNRYNIKNNHPGNDLDTKLKTHPMWVLQELCMSRNWPMPEYEYFVNSRHTYSVKCTVLECSVKCEGYSKKAAKRQAATIMYRTVENVAKVGSVETTLDRGQEDAADESLTDSFKPMLKN